MSLVYSSCHYFELHGIKKNGIRPWNLCIRSANKHVISFRKIVFINVKSGTGLHYVFPSPGAPLLSLAKILLYLLFLFFFFFLHLSLFYFPSKYSSDLFAETSRLIPTGTFKHKTLSPKRSFIKWWQHMASEWHCITAEKEFSLIQRQSLHGGAVQGGSSTWEFEHKAKNWLSLPKENNLIVQTIQKQWAM